MATDPGINVIYTDVSVECEGILNYSIPCGFTSESYPVTIYESDPSFAVWECPRCFQNQKTDL